MLFIGVSGGLLWGAPSGAEAALSPADLPDEPGETTPTDPEECGRLDYPCRAGVTFYEWVAGFIGDAIEFTITLAALPALATPPPTDGIRTIWGEHLAVANSLYVLVIITAGILLMSYQSVQTSAGAKELLPRVVLGFIAANSSFLLVEMMRELANGIALSMLDGAATLDNVTETLARVFGNPRGEALVLLLLMVVGSLLSFFFMLAAILRIVLWILLTAIAPLALACHALPQTEVLARLWWRAMGALMIIQIAQAVVLRLMVVLFLSRNAAPDFIEAAENVVDVLLIICAMYVMVRIPFWAFKQVFNYQNSPLVKGTKLVASLLIFRGLGKAFAAKKGAAASRAAGRPSGPGPSRASSGRLAPGQGRGGAGLTPSRVRADRGAGRVPGPGPGPGATRAAALVVAQGPDVDVVAREVARGEARVAVPEGGPDLAQAQLHLHARGRTRVVALVPATRVPEGGPKCRVYACPLMSSARTRSSQVSPHGNSSSLLSPDLASGSSTRRQVIWFRRWPWWRWPFPSWAGRWPPPWSSAMGSAWTA
ncbi:hypothetical protein GCM10028793_47970 [Nocardiopsis oceani]